MLKTNKISTSSTTLTTTYFHRQEIRDSKIDLILEETHDPKLDSESLTIVSQLVVHKEKL